MTQEKKITKIQPLSIMGAFFWDYSGIGILGTETVIAFF